MLCSCFLSETELDARPECDMKEAPLMPAVQSPDAINREMNIQEPPCAAHENNFKRFIFLPESRYGSGGAFRFFIAFKHLKG